MKQNFKLTDEYIIKNKNITVSESLLIIFFLIFLFFMIEFEIEFIYIIICIGIVTYGMHKFLKRQFDRRAKIIINKNGIKLCKEDKLIEWNIINYAYIKKEITSYGKDARSINYFYIETKNKIIDIDMSDYSFNKETIIKSVEYFSGRNIGEFEDLLNDNVKEIIGSKMNIDQISKICIDYIKRQKKLSIIQFLILFVISFILQLIIDFHYVFAIGFTLMIVIMFLVDRIEEKRLRNREYIKDLDDEKFKKVLIEYAKACNIDKSKSFEKKAMVLIILSTILIYIFSYLIGNQII